jgi:hypothetical protein
VGSSQLVKVTQLLTSFPTQHVQNAFDSQDGKIVVQLPNGTRHSVHFPGNPVNHFLYLRAFSGEGKTPHFNFIKL